MLVYANHVDALTIILELKRYLAFGAPMMRHERHNTLFAKRCETNAWSVGKPEPAPLDKPHAKPTGRRIAGSFLLDVSANLAYEPSLAGRQEDRRI
jgi:hypothetical protein